MWVEDPMPVEVGDEVTSAAYRASETNCKSHRYNINVIKCSNLTSNDYIYKYADSYYRRNCNFAFCGMF